MEIFDDGPVKPVRIWSRVGRRPIVAGGNSNGDIPMLRFAGGGGRPALRLLLLHDDAEREFDYTAGAESPLRGRAPRAGRWSASGRTGRPCSAAEHAAEPSRNSAQHGRLAPDHTARLRHGKERRQRREPASAQRFRTMGDA